MRALQNRKIRLFAAGVSLALLFAAGAVYARNKTVFVNVRSAKLREGTEEGQAKAVCYIPYGEPVEVLEENETYYKVKWGQQVGWMHKSQVGDRRPPAETRGKSLSGLTKMTGSQAAAAGAGRGLLEGKRYAEARGLDKEFKYVELMETFAPTPEALDAFLREGGLGPYTE
ncbi:MAG TPA: SH3 domain-containing protein [Planctomycetes bacterium]|nr:SH3 domain-containing protein [Planctomycetota bacterium]